MHAVLVSMGTAGDVYPFIGLGIALRARGHRVTLVANERYAGFADQYDFDFADLLSEGALQQLLADPDLWKPLRSAFAGARWARDRLPQQYETISKAVQAADDPVLVAYPPVMAARQVHESLGIRLVSLVPMPWMIPSVVKPARMAGMLQLPNAGPWPLRAAYWWSLNALTDRLIGRQVNELRKSLRMPPVRGVARWTFSRDLTIGMFPEWYAPVQSDWPHNTRLVGFSEFDGAAEANLPHEMLDFCQAGDPPVVFTFGSGMQHADLLFQKAAQICANQHWRAVFVSPHQSQLPASLPKDILPCTYVPFHQLLPHCAALVHHGGMGTTAQALAAGIPQLITPFAWDQYDNAARIKRLHVGNWCRPNRSGRRWTALLKPLLANQQRAACQQIAERMLSQNASARAAQMLEEFAQG